MSSISGDSYNNYPNTIDGLTFINVNGNNITGNYLNQNTDTTGVNTNITLSNGGVFTVKDLTGNELIKCDNNTSITTFYRPETSFVGNTANSIPNLQYGFDTYWFKSGSNNISGSFSTAPSGSIWFQTSTGQTYILMQGTGVQVNNPTLTNTINLFTLFNSFGASNQLLMIDSSGNLQNAFNLTYVYGDANATILTTVPSNIGAQQQTIQWTRDFTINGLYGWKLTTATINKMPLVSDLPITINNLYSTAMYPTSLVINGLDTTTEIKSSKIRSNNTLLTLSNSTGIEFTVDSDRFKFFGILDLRGIFVGIFGRIQYNVISGWEHTFAVNSVRLFSISSVSSIPTITSNGYFTLTDNVNNKVYSDAIGLYTQGSGGSYSLMSSSGNVFMTSSGNSTLALLSGGTVNLSAGVGGALNLNMGASLYSKTGFTCSLGVNNTNIISVYDDQHGNDTLFFSRNTNDPNILFGTDITANNVIGQATSNGGFSTDASAGDLVIRNNNKNIRFGTNGGGASNFIINSNGSVTVNNRSAQVHQLTLKGQDFLGISSGSGISLNCGVNQSGNKQFWMMDPDLPFNSSNKIIRIMPGNGAIDCISSNVYLPLEVLGSTFITNNTTTINGVNSDRLSSLIINTLRAGVSLTSNLSGAVQWNFWAGGSSEAFGASWYLYNVTNGAFRFTVGGNGNIWLNAYTTNGTLSVSGGNGLITSSSDIRLKENINYITDTKKGLDQILELKPCEFNFKANKEHTQLGLIAQDVEKIVPISVDGKKYEYQAKRDFDNKLVYDEKGEVEYELDEEGNKKIRPRGLDYNAIVCTQILAIQELNKQNQEFRELLNQQNEIIEKQNTEIREYKDKVNHLLLNQENLTKQVIDMTHQINNLTSLFSKFTQTKS